jgi:alkyl hydroperoxide reductase subunit AhpC
MRRIVSAAVALLVVAAVLSSAKSNTASIGVKAPEFTLTDINGKNHSLSQYKGKYVVLEWVNYGCPFVAKHYDSGNMQKLQKEMTGKGIVWLSICSSAKGKEGYMEPAEWKKENTAKKTAATATLLDPEGTVGKLYDAKTTPHMFVVDPQGVLIYHGAIDNKPTYKQSDVRSAQNYVRAALDEAMAGKPVSTASTESYGCSIKYK